MKKYLMLFILVNLILVLSACGGGEDSGQDDTSNVEEGTPLNITATNFAFDQEEYTVQSGEPVTIHFKSEEGNHGIDIDGVGVSIRGDGKATFTAGEPGEYNIICNIPCGAGHSDMHATLIVQ